MSTICIVKNRPIELYSFKINSGFIFALKSITNESENDIVSYFTDLGIRILNDCFSKRYPPRRCLREVVLLYKQTNMPFRLEVWTSYLSYDGFSSKNDPARAYISVSFPKESTTIPGKEVLDMIAERGLSLCDDQLLTATKPIEKTYRFLNKVNSHE